MEEGGNVEVAVLTPGPSTIRKALHEVEACFSGWVTYLGQIIGPSPWNRTQIAAGGGTKTDNDRHFRDGGDPILPDRFDGSDRSGGNFDIPAIFFP